MGCEATMVRRKRGHLRPLLSWRGAVARRRGKSAAPESYGAGDDVFHAAQFLLLRRRVRRLVARMDLEQHRARYSETQESCRAANSRRNCGNVEARASAHGNVSAAARLARPERHRAVLLRVAGASGR